jgi:hypothetical protein
MLVAGYERDFNEFLRYWHTRFVVVPTKEPPALNAKPGGERLDDEQIRLFGMEKPAEHFTTFIDNLLTNASIIPYLPFASFPQHLDRVLR